MAQTNTAHKTKNAPNLTPMMKQYMAIKADYEDAILFFRLGDFYEMFFDDAVEASKILDITLTNRNKNSENPIPLCGIPYHSAESYLAKLVSHGKKVVVCEQTEDPKQAKGIVKREVTRVITPGTVTEEQSLSARENNFILCIFPNEEQSFECSICDITTGKFEFFSVKDHLQLRDEIIRLDIKELLYPEKDSYNKNIRELLEIIPNLYHHFTSDLYFDEDFAKDLIKTQFQVNDILSLGIESHFTTLGGMLGYLQESKLLEADLLQQPTLRRIDQGMLLDETTIHQLELFKTLQEKKRHGTLIWHLDQCSTVMGSRKLAEIIRSPLMDLKKIEERLEAVNTFYNDAILEEKISESLKFISDLERLANRFVLKKATPRDAVALKDGFIYLNHIKQRLLNSGNFLLEKLAHSIELFPKLEAAISTCLIDEPPTNLKEGGFIRSNYNQELDELRDIEKNGKKLILNLEASEKEKTKIPSLKVRYNNVFGYYIEVTNTHKDKVPKHYVRKQTLTNAERYITDELKELENKVLGASERIKIIEQELFHQLRDQIALEAQNIKKTADAIAMTDVLISFAKVSKQFRYTKPKITNHVTLDLKGARHPILEKLDLGENFIPNDIYLDISSCSEMIITGPNMAGKSTVMRMTALITLMGQLGCFVPCDSANIGICDRIFTRVGAHDHLQKGLSTFMVEMVETAKILREATPKSLILLDEIGRGTSTFDGLSIAWAVAEDLHDRLKSRTLFATHYHELCDLANQKKGIKNFHVAVKEWNGEIIFLRKLKSGGTNRSYGVAVASMAGLPSSTIKRAREILKLLEVKDLSFQSDLGRTSDNQMILFEEKQPQLPEVEAKALQQLKQLDVNQLTPIQALNFLAKLTEDF